MPQFRYKAKAGPSRPVDGSLYAESRENAMAELERMGLSPVWIAEAEERTAGRKHFFPGRIRPSEITVFTRQLASLLRSGVPILSALTTLVEQTENRRLARELSRIGQQIRKGGMLSDAMAERPALFSSLYINMIRSGESGGVLDTVLVRLAETREAEEELRRKVRAALAYPALVLTVGALTVFILLSFFMPRVVALFDNYARLPLPTRVLIGLSEFFDLNKGWIALLLLLVAVVLNRLAALEQGRMFLDRIKLGLPFFGRLLRDAEVARFARTLALMLDAGIAIDRALRLAADTLDNAVLRAEIMRIRSETVELGTRVSAGLKRSSLFPLFAANMVAVGEESGRLDEALLETAAFYTVHLNHQTRIVTSLLEPLLILVVGGIVGFIVAAMLLPIFQISSGM